ncbi:POK11 protein, partial [Odontophorus gujanensis]|nr:POK11 protein [Odontophorus gujanensis]
ISHDFFQQLAKVLAKQFDLPLVEAGGFVQSCLDCQGLVPAQAINSRGLRSLQICQMDVTHVPEFGNVKHVYVCIDTFSHAIWATGQ